MSNYKSLEVNVAIFMKKFVASIFDKKNDSKQKVNEKSQNWQCVVFDSTNPNFARHKYFPGPGWCIMKMQKVQEFVCSNVFSYFERCEPVRSGSGLVERKINEKWMLWRLDAFEQ